MSRLPAVDRPGLWWEARVVPVGGGGVLGRGGRGGPVIRVVARTDDVLDFTIKVPETVDWSVLFGPAERHLKMVRESLGVGVAARRGEVRLSGEATSVDAARRVIERQIDAAERGRPMGRRQILDLIAEAAFHADRGVPSAVEPVEGALAGQTWTGRLNVTAAGRPILARSANQEVYLDSVFEHDLTFGIGPAGTGKTFLAVAAAVHMLKSGRVRRAILARPAVEAGERLGFLPGDHLAKLDPYLRPLLDALNDMLDYATIKRFMASDVIEVVPLAYMRGRTLNDAVIILDEAQNATRGQMQMFLTRMGQRSKMIITGDVTQIDLPDPTQSGLIDAARRLRRVPGVAMCVLAREDVVRHPLVQRIIAAYEPKQTEEDRRRREAEALDLDEGTGDAAAEHTDA